MRIDYEYKYSSKDNRYNFQRMEIILQISDENKIDIYNQWSSLIINKNNGSYSATAYDRNNNIQKYYIPEIYFKGATLKELLPHDKPIILTKNSKCEYIKELDDNGFSFIINSADGKIIKMDFNINSILVYFRDINILYVYNDIKKDKNSLYNTSIYSDFTEKHVIMDGYGIFSEYNKGIRQATFIPLRNDLSVLNFNEYYEENSDKYDIIPHYFKKYNTCLDNNHNKQDLSIDPLLLNKIDNKLFDSIKEYNNSNGAYIKRIRIITLNIEL